MSEIKFVSYFSRWGEWNGKRRAGTSSTTWPWIGEREAKVLEVLKVRNSCRSLDSEWWGNKSIFRALISYAFLRASRMH